MIRIIVREGLVCFIENGVGRQQVWYLPQYS
jgi:hypothetical protein